MSREDFDRYIAEMPEPKLELYDGRLVVGNEAGNLVLLRELLKGWGAEAGVPMADTGLWWQALHQGFQAYGSPSPEKPPSVWRAWAAQLNYEPELSPAGPMLNWAHANARECLMMGLYGLTHSHHFAQVAARDVIMRLGEDAFTPDVWVAGPERARSLNSHYLDVPADLVIEVLFPGHETYDREFKRQRYCLAGIPEYWLVDPVKQTVQLLRLRGQDYQPGALDPDGKYRVPAFPGLTFEPAKLWEPRNNWQRGVDPFSLEGRPPAVPRTYASGGVAWGDLAFNPRPALLPGRLTFDEFASWAPEAKFERVDGKPWIGGSRGSRNVLGMFLRTEGLVRAVTVLHPNQWIAALVRAEEDRRGDESRRSRWWAAARQAAALLREQSGVGRLVVIGDLVEAQPLNVWSMITLVAIDLPSKFDIWNAYQKMHDQLPEEPEIDLICYEEASSSEQAAVAAQGVDLD